MYSLSSRFGVTYEGLKQCVRSEVYKSHFCFGVTYEGLKHRVAGLD